MNTKPRILLATLVAPLAVGPAVLVALPLYYLASLQSVSSNEDVGDLLVEWLGVTLFMTVFGAVIAFFAILVVGLPVYGILRYFELARPLPCALLAGVIGLVGWFVAKILRDLVQNLLRVVGFDKLGEKAGLSGNVSLSQLAGLLVFIFVFVPALVGALNT